VQVIEETVFPIECMANDPTAQAIVKDAIVKDAIVKDAKLPPERIKELEHSVVSIKVRGVKRQ